MKVRTWIAIFFAVILSVYVGMTIQKKHPMDQLLTDTIQHINQTRVISFKSGFSINYYDKDFDLIDQWQFKRRGVYDAWSKYIHYENLTRFEEIVSTVDDDEDKETSLTPQFEGNTVLLPIKEAYYKNRMYFTKSRVTNEWNYQEKQSFDLLELLPFNSELINRYAHHYRSENRGPFVVLFFSVDPNYLTRTFPDILIADNHHFPLEFLQGTIKLLVYPDSPIPKRAYCTYMIKNIDTGDIFEYNIDVYYSINSNYTVDEEPAIPEYIKQISKK
ncbi:hypothetical protein J2S00_002672 [Caldalkalibacillus uzonensis]|uniref:Uncharacterized protein n=1 Tax=Caldalkalibacillus uzonensis TaxID=353224 RepID=A0ABU0CTX8_9BACI|nr:hypothetical protein [Caldalkalibacillus uzonensis]MDQ0339877.1 hypothetical protein [Caldalkalibacillus uzonensis]